MTNLRIKWGGSFFSNSSLTLGSEVLAFNTSTYENVDAGFRVANVPEPSSFVLAALGLIGFAVWGWRLKR